MDEGFLIQRGVLTGYSGTETDLVIPDGVRIIGTKAFENCLTLRSVKFPPSVTVIKSDAFQSCTALERVEFAEGLQTIMARAFKHCTDLKSIRLPESLVNLNRDAFLGCGLTHVVLPKQITTLKYGVFSYIRLQEIVMLGEMQSIVQFSCMEAAVVTAPNTPFEVFPTPLKIPACIGFARLLQKGEAVPQRFRESYLRYIRSQRKRLYDAALEYPELLWLMLEEQILPKTDFDDVLAQSIQQGRTTCTAMLLEYQQKVFGPPDPEKAFRKQMRILEAGIEPVAMVKKKWRYEKKEDGAIRLKKYIGTEADVVLPFQIGKSQVTEVGPQAFAGCRTVTSVTIPSSITVLAPTAFTGCETLREFLPAPDHPCFTAQDGMLLGKDGVLLAYPSAFGDVVLPEGVTKLGPCVFMFHPALLTITLPESLTEIGERAFFHCAGLTAVCFSENLRIIGGEAFCGCRELTGVVLPKSLTKLDHQAFAYCTRLSCVTLQAELDQVYGDIFKGSWNLAIYAPAGSKTAKRFAKRNGLPFYPL